MIPFVPSYLLFLYFLSFFIYFGRGVVCDEILIYKNYLWNYGTSNKFFLAYVFVCVFNQTLMSIYVCGLNIAVSGH